MLVLALDTATPSVVVGVIDLGPPAESGWIAAAVRAAESVSSGNRHAETLGELIPAVLREGGVGMSELGAVVVGLGPGPFTGLRVGVVTAAALGDALSLPVYGVCTHDAIATTFATHATHATHATYKAHAAHAADAAHVAHAPAPAEGDTAPDEGFAVVTDARRRECYWACYNASGARISGPYVERPADLLVHPDWRPSGLVIGDPAFSDGLGTEVRPAQPDPMGLAFSAVGLSSGQAPRPLTPLYLRRPDATPPPARKLMTPR